ncbi:MAG TPA: histidine kinase dimerization/phospho-acceptor domain-containing protein [Verrucomicrobiae bacterium]|nr:histidine kinase dimerization/phospho-acceptor domain-containing protein [Verrucomicrobiae bacterium]
MSLVAIRTEVFSEPLALAGIARAEIALRLATLMEKTPYSRRFSAVPTLAQFQERAARGAGQVLLLDEDLLGGAPMADALASLPHAAPVIFLGAPERQEEAAHLVARREIEFVTKAGDFSCMAAAVVARGMEAAAKLDRVSLPRGVETSADLSEIFRHEINNPLTGILGNAELLLTHRDRLPAPDGQRLQTIVELAVRLRETIRRLSNDWEASAQAERSL